MKTLWILALATLLASTAAYAEDTASNATKGAKTRAVAAKSDATPTAESPAAVKPVVMSQQDRMRACAKQATGKKGAERKTFMKTCLSHKA